MNSITKIVLYCSFVILAAWLADAKTDYCKKTLCQTGPDSYTTHIACKNNKRFAKRCPKDAKIVKMTTTLQNLFVDQFNEKRNFVAGGNVPQLEPACRMGTIKWDNELAEMAELNVKQCVMDHDSCHNTETYMHSGQNLGIMAFSGTPNDTEKITECVDMWYNEVDHVTLDVIKLFPTVVVGPMIGHFTAMVQERNIAIGCAASTYHKKEDGFTSYLVACNFGYVMFVGCAVYETCATAGEKCATGTNPQYPNLCSTSEQYAVNEFP